MIWLCIYIGLSIFFGSCVAAIEIFTEEPLLMRTDGRGYFKSPKMSALAIGLFVAAIWPLLLIGAIL